MTCNETNVTRVKKNVQIKKEQLQTNKNDDKVKNYGRRSRFPNR